MAARTYEDYRSLRVFPGLDALRGLSILCVVWHHAGVPVASVPMTARGFFGVDVFFVLSGFLIVTLLLRERERHGAFSLRNFYLRRALRIFPLYYGVLLGLCVLLWVKPDFSLAATFWDELLGLLTYTSNWLGASGLLAVTWSLAAEEQFYLLWPPIERWLGRWWLPLWLGALAVNQAANFSLLDPWLPVGFRHDDLDILQATFTPILLGVGLAHALHHRRGYERLVPILTRPAVRLAMLAAVIGVLNLAPELAGWPRLTLHLLVAGLLASGVTRSAPASTERGSEPATRGLGASIASAGSWLLARLGRVSYGVYLLHMFVMHVGRESILPRSPLRFPGDLFVLCLVGTWVVAELSFRLYEQPFLRLKHRFSRA